MRTSRPSSGGGDREASLWADPGAGCCFETLLAKHTARMVPGTIPDSNSDRLSRRSRFSHLDCGDREPDDQSDGFGCASGIEGPSIEDRREIIFESGSKSDIIGSQLLAVRIEMESSVPPTRQYATSDGQLRPEENSDKSLPGGPTVQPVVPAVFLQTPTKSRDLLDIVSKVAGIALPVLLFFATYSVNRGQAALQQAEQSQSRNEQQLAHAMDKLAGLGDSSVSVRAAAAKWLRSDALIGNLDGKIVPALLPYLYSECDATVFRITRDAALIAAKNEESDVIDKLKSIKLPACIAQASNAESAPPTPTANPGGSHLTQASHYVDVGCGEQASATMFVPVPSQLSSSQKIQSASASIVSVANLGQGSMARVVNLTDAGDAAGANVTYSVVGQPRGFLGNCPGGGHATIVTTFSIGPK